MRHAYPGGVAVSMVGLVTLAGRVTSISLGGVP
jgi:hypothetical protein